MAEDQNANQNKNAQFQSNQPTQKLDANGKPIQGQSNVQKPIAPTADKNAEAAKNRSM